jgi:hypothetical protein
VFLVRDLSGVLHLNPPSLPWALPLSFFTFYTSIACMERLDSMAALSAATRHVPSEEAVGW